MRERERRDRDGEVADCCYRFSGLTAQDFDSVETTIEDVQQKILSLVATDTILLGHSLESDLRALKVRINHTHQSNLPSPCPPSLSLRLFTIV